MRGVVAGALVVLALAVVTAAAGSSSVPLAQRVINFAGMTPNKTPAVVRSAASWADGSDVTKAQLVKWGFVGGVGAQLSTPGNANRYGLSLVAEFSSAAGAAAYLRPTYTTHGPWKRFAVSGIPGAVGFAQTDSGEGGSNVGFVAGPYAYVVGVGWQGGKSNEIANETLIAAAKQLYSRVK
ncbi:MAG TPA: hypothetical protein VHX66_03080 [Solirubrobacteraceae bacterium]|jgi:hypothetical protein|nr:hypothetical protein [Solirubrobacteraceae bacterium]